MTSPRPLTPGGQLITPPAPVEIRVQADLARLAAEMRGQIRPEVGSVAEHAAVAARVVCLGRQTFQLMLRPGPDHQIQLLVSSAGYRFPDAWLPDLRAAFGVPDGTLMVYDLVKRVHQVVKWTWVVDAPAEQLQMSFAELGGAELRENYYQRGRG